MMDGMKGRGEGGDGSHIRDGRAAIVFIEIGRWIIAGQCGSEYFIVIVAVKMINLAALIAGLAAPAAVSAVGPRIAANNMTMPPEYANIMAADPPKALPQKATANDLRWQPVLDCSFSIFFRRGSLFFSSLANEEKSTPTVATTCLPSTQRVTLPRD